MNPIFATRTCNSSPRIFPPIQPGLFTKSITSVDLTPDQRAATQLLHLATQKRSSSTLLLGWNLNAIEKIGRLFFLYKTGMEAEIAGKWQRADHFWSFVEDQLQVLTTHEDVWAHIASSLSQEAQVAILADPVQLRYRLLTEVFLDTYCAFYNGYVQEAKSLKWDNRPFVHLDRIRSFLRFVELSEDDYYALLGPTCEQWLTLCETEKQWSKGLQICTDLLHFLPHNETYVNLWARFYVGNTMSRLKQSKSEQANKKDATTLQASIDQMVSMHKEYPYNLTLLTMIGHLYHQQAISLVTAGQLAESIQAAHKAIIYSPSLEDAKKTRETLIQTMQHLQQQVKALDERMQNQGNVRLNAQGVRMRNEAIKGFGPFNQYANSTEAQNVTQAYSIAQGHHLWLEIGLPEPIDAWDSRASELLWGISKILIALPATKEGLTEAWERATAEYSSLADLDVTLIYTFLNGKLFGNSENIDNVDADTPSVQKLPPPIIKDLPSAEIKGSEPFAFWLFSRRDKGLKIQAAIAILLFCLICSLALRDWHVRNMRSFAYIQVLSAQQNQNYLGVIESAEEYFANKPFSGNDGRDGQVRKIYAQAFVRWFASANETKDTNAQRHIEQYKAILGKDNK